MLPVLDEDQPSVETSDQPGTFGGDEPDWFEKGLSSGDDVRIPLTIEPSGPGPSITEGDQSGGE